MKIEQFVAQSEGNWRSMRSGHSLAFRQFEQVLSEIKIKCLKLDNPEVTELIKFNQSLKYKPVSPFRIAWEADSDWEPEDPSQIKSGSCILIPFPITSNKGIIIRSSGYIEAVKSSSTYSFLSDNTFILRTKYQHSISEERIWFISKNVRCRSSVVYTSEGTGILQTSFASEVRHLSNNA